MVDGGLIRRMHLDGIVTAQAHASQLLVREMLDHLEQARIRSEEILPEVGAALDEILLILPVADLAHAPHQQPVAVGLNQRIPIGAPDDLDDIPARAPENRFQFLDDLSVAAHRAIEPLQVAVHDEDQVIEPFTRGQRNRAQRLRLVHLAVAQEGPYLAPGGLLQPAVLEILDEARVIDRLDGTEPHRDGGELPEILHQPGMGIRRETSARLQFAAEVLELLLGNAAFEKRAGINAGRRVSLEIHDVAITVFGARAQEMVEGDFVKRGRGGKSRNVAANAFLDFVGPNDHSERVPAHQALDPALHFLAAGEGRLGFGWYRVLVRRGRGERQVQARGTARV